MRIKTIVFEIEGIVQGVGFRPFVYSLAKRYNLFGYVLNHSKGVTINIQGEYDKILSFENDLIKELPPSS